MGANLYGVATPTMLPVYFAPPTGSLINIPAAVDTIYCTSPLLSTNTPGYVFPMVWGTLAIQWGAAIPASIVWTWRIGGGSDLNQLGINQNPFSANGTTIFSMTFTGPPSNVIWRPPGSVLNFGILTVTNGVQVNPVGSWFVATLFRAPDQ